MLLASDSTALITVDQKIAEFFNNNFGLGGDWPWGNLLLCVISILLCVLLCGIVGFEREKRGRSAGLRTHLLVGVGSCMIMIISVYGFPAIFPNRDVARLATQVVAGVGFLGAGAIIHNNGGIKGLTTASTIWLVMAIGLCCGSMNFILAIGGTFVVMVVLISFRRIERLASKSNPVFIMLAPSDVPVMSILLSVAKDYGCAVTDVTSQIVNNSGRGCIEVTFSMSAEHKNEVDVDGIIKELETKAQAVSIQVLNHH